MYSNGQDVVGEVATRQATPLAVQATLGSPLRERNSEPRCQGFLPGVADRQGSQSARGLRVLHHVERHVLLGDESHPCLVQVRLKGHLIAEAVQKVQVEQVQALITKKLPGYGLDYWAKFLYGSLGLHIDERLVPVKDFSIIGVGPRDMLIS